MIARLTKITADCTNEDIAIKPAFERVDFIETGLFLFKALCAEEKRNVNDALIKYFKYSYLDINKVIQGFHGRLGLNGK
jgi:hypothetical protein